MTSSASAACSTLTCSSVRRPASIVVSRSSSQSISPRPLRRWNSFLWLGCSARNSVLGGVVLQVHLLLAHDGRVQRRLGDVDVPVLDQLLHLAEEEREQQRADVAAVDVGVAQEDDLVVADLGHVELLAHARRRWRRSASGSRVFFSILSRRARSTLRILPRIGRIAWVCGSRA